MKINLEFFEDINNLNKIAKKLRIQRENKGSIDFNIPEPLIKLDKNGILIIFLRKKDMIVID